MDNSVLSTLSDAPYLPAVGIVFLLCAVGTVFLSSPIEENEPKSLCPVGAGRVKKKPNRRAILNRISLRPFSVAPVKERLSKFWVTRQVNRKSVHVSKKSFWELYKVVANEQTGLMGENCTNIDFSDVPKLGAIVQLAENESPEKYSKGRADEYRAWLAWRLTEIDSEDGGCDLQVELESLNTSRAKVVLSGCVYLRHAWHQGNPNEEPIPDMDPEDSYGSIIEEPPQLKMVVEYCAKKLQVVPYFNVYSWLFCNWKWTPADSSTPIDKFMGTKKDETLTQEKITDLSAGTLSPRFFWLTGPARESEANFWRAFAYSEFVAVPMYGEVGKLLDEANRFKYKNPEGNPPTPDSIANVLKSLNKIHDVAHNITAALVARAVPELIDQNHFIQLQYTAHYAGINAGASGFQAPCIVMLDMLLGVDHSTLSQQLQNARQENIDEMHPEVASLLFGVVQPGARVLREYIESVPSKEKMIQLKTAFNQIVESLLMWRSSHRARAGKYVAASTVTTGRTNEEMLGNVGSTFMDEMSSIITVTKATLYQLE